MTLQKNYYVYSNDKCKIVINKTPIWFEKVKVEGNHEKGTIFFESHDEFDENFGKSVKIELSWYQKVREEYYHAREVQDSIDTYNSINIVVTKKENIWLLSHECTYWFGTRTKMIRKGYYPSKIIHSVFFCEITGRVITIHFEVIRKYYLNYEKFIIEMLQSIICH